MVVDGQTEKRKEEKRMNAMRRYVKHVTSKMVALGTPPFRKEKKLLAHYSPHSPT